MSPILNVGLHGDAIAKQMQHASSSTTAFWSSSKGNATTRFAGACDSIASSSVARSDLAAPSVARVSLGRPAGWLGSTVIALASLIQPCGSSNWAQVSGDNRQNTAISAATPWTRRWGFAMAVVENLAAQDNPDLVVPEDQKSRVYLIGGDSYRKDTSKDTYHANGDSKEYFFRDGRQKDPNYNAADNEWSATGSGDLLNDVWYTTGASWEVFTDERIRGPYNDPYPTIISKASWTAAPKWEGVPEDVDGWREYLGCCHETKPFPCPVTDEFGAGLCDAGIDPYKQSRRFSPRRGHVAVTVYPSGSTLNNLHKPVIVVLGGRAKSYERMSGNELAGGFIGDPFAMLAERQRAVLLSDVWISNDGVTWDFTNPGCWVPQQDQVKAPGTFQAATEGGSCSTDFDCWKAKHGDATCVNGFCVCRHWSARERFAAVAVDERIYIAGGVRYSQQFLCGRFSCGNEYATHLNDVWRSDDLGKTWIEMIAMADWAPRADFAFVYASSRFWVFGGRGGDPRDDSTNPLYNDAWASSDAQQWTLNTSSAVWGPRCYHSVLSRDGVLYMLMGEVEVALPPVVKLADLSIADQVVAAAAQAPSNVDHSSEAAYEEPPSGENVNGMQIQPIGDVYVHYLDSLSAERDLYGRERNVWWRDYGDEMQWQALYIEPDSPLTALRHYPPAYTVATGRLAPAFMMVNYTDEVLAALSSVGINTIAQLALPSLNQILRLRDPDDLNVPDVCFEVRRAQFLMSKCDIVRRGYDAESLKFVVVVEADVTASNSDSASIGCDDVPPMAAVDTFVNDYVCRQHPSARRSFGSGIMDGRVYVSAGWEGTDVYSNDLWYRDDKIPLSIFTRVPADQSSDTVFEFDADEEGCAFEYKMIDVQANFLMRDWSRAASPFDAYAINGNHRETLFRIRAIDPAGNRDDSERYGKNVWKWTYVPPLPLLAIILSILVAVLIMGTAWYLWRRYQKKKALERYMAKRLARKLKAGGASDADTLLGKKKKKKKGKGRKVKRVIDREAARREAEMRNKFKLLLAGRAERTVRGDYELLAKRTAAKDVYLKDGGEAGKKDRIVARELREDAMHFREEARDAKGALLKGSLAGGGYTSGGGSGVAMGRSEGSAALALFNAVKAEGDRFAAQSGQMDERVMAQAARLKQQDAQHQPPRLNLGGTGQYRGGEPPSAPPAPVRLNMSGRPVAADSNGNDSDGNIQVTVIPSDNDDRGGGGGRRASAVAADRKRYGSLPMTTGGAAMMQLPGSVPSDIDQPGSDTGGAGGRGRSGYNPDRSMPIGSRPGQPRSRTPGQWRPAGNDHQDSPGYLGPSDEEGKSPPAGVWYPAKYNGRGVGGSMTGPGNGPDEHGRGESGELKDNRPRWRG